MSFLLVSQDGDYFSEIFSDSFTFTFEVKVKLFFLKSLEKNSHQLGTTRDN